MPFISNMEHNFCVTGELARVSYRKQQPRRIKVKTEQGKFWIKLPKKLRALIANFTLGSQLTVSGHVKKKEHAVIYKAKTVGISKCHKNNKTDRDDFRSASASVQAKQKAKVLVCQKSNCWKKGGRQLCNAIESALDDRGLASEITIKKTGCLKQCKKAPALVMMPDKARYTKVKPKQIAKLVTKHLVACS